MIDFKEWKQAFSNINNMRVLLYLYRYNPGISFKELETNLGIDESNLKHSIEELIKAKAIKTDKKGYTLTLEARLAISRLMEKKG